MISGGNLFDDGPYGFSHAAQKWGGIGLTDKDGEDRGLVHDQAPKEIGPFTRQAKGDR
jgi:hypothetical protein